MPFLSIRITQTVNKTLKIAIIVDNEIISDFQADFIAWSHKIGNIDISNYLYLINNEKKQLLKKLQTLNIFSIKNLRRNIKNLIILLEKNRNIKNSKYHKNSMRKHKIHSFNLKKIELNLEVSKSETSFTVSKDSIKLIKEEGFDLIINFSEKEISGELLNLSNFGIISIDYGSNLDNISYPIGFWEVLNSEIKSGYFIKQITNNVYCQNILFQGHISTQKSWLLNWAELNLRSFYYLKKIILELGVSSKLPKSFKNNQNIENLNKNPKIYELIKYLFNKYKNKIEIKKYKNKNNRFFVGYQEIGWESFNYTSTNFIENPENSYLADPYIISKNNKNYCFLESYDLVSEKGRIDVYELTKNTNKYLGTAIEEKFHLSFPYLLETENEIYLIPESSKNRDVRIYKCIDFPLEWKLENVIMEDIDTADSIIFHYENLWWLLTNEDDLSLGAHNYQLNIYYSDSLLSKDWKPHKLNPVILDPSFGRNGGFIKKDDSFYRIAQKCGFNQKYGEGITIRKIQEITNESYKEEEVAAFINFDGSDILGSHHLSSNNIYTVFDVWKMQ